MYEEASKFFRQSFDSAKEINDIDAVESTRTEYGIGHAHELFDRYTRFVVLNNKNANSKVMAWRDSRADMQVLDQSNARENSDKEVSQPQSDAS